MPSSCPRLVLVAEVRDCANCPAHSAEDWRRHALFMAKQSKVPSRTERGQRRGRLRLDAALEAAADGRVAGLQVGRAVRRDEAQHDVRERRPPGGHVGRTGVDAGHVREKDPRLSFLVWVRHVVQSGRQLQDRGRRLGILLFAVKIVVETIS